MEITSPSFYQTKFNEDEGKFEVSNWNDTERVLYPSDTVELPIEKVGELYWNLLGNRHTLSVIDESLILLEQIAQKIDLPVADEFLSEGELLERAQDERAYMRHSKNWQEGQALNDICRAQQLFQSPIEGRVSELACRVEYLAAHLGIGDHPVVLSLINEGILQKDIGKILEILLSNSVDLNKIYRFATTYSFEAGEDEETITFRTLEDSTGSTLLGGIVLLYIDESISTTEMSSILDLLIEFGMDLNAPLDTWGSSIVEEVLELEPSEQKRELMKYLVSRKELVNPYLGSNPPLASVRPGLRTEDALESMQFLKDLGADFSKYPCSLGGIFEHVNTPYDFYDVLNFLVSNNAKIDGVWVPFWAEDPLNEYDIVRYVLSYLPADKVSMALELILPKLASDLEAVSGESIQRKNAYFSALLKRVEEFSDDCLVEILQKLKEFNAVMDFTMSETQNEMGQVTVEISFPQKIDHKVSKPVYNTYPEYQYPNISVDEYPKVYTFLKTIEAARA